MLNQRIMNKAILAAACVGIGVVSAQASPLATYSLLGRIAGSGDAFQSRVTVSTGATVEYQLRANFAAIGTVNVQSNTTRTITSIGATDGFGVLPRIDLFQPAGATIDAQFDSHASFPNFVGPFIGGGLVTSNFSVGTGASPGTPTSGDLLNIKAITGSGVVAASGTPIALGTFNIASVAGTSSLIGMRLTAAVAAGVSGFRVHINGSTAATGTTILSQDLYESGPDPFVGLHSLTLVQANPNNLPSLDLTSGIVGSLGAHLTLDAVWPIGSPHSASLSITDAMIIDESPSTVGISLRPLPAPLLNHVSLAGRTISVSSSFYGDLPLGSYSIPITLTDTLGATTDASVPLVVVPEPGIVTVGIGALLLLVRRRHRPLSRNRSADQRFKA